MPSGRLTPLQERVLRVLAPVEPPWTLTGGGALAGVHFGHRVTRDLDLFWHGRDGLGELREEVERRLRGGGFVVTRLHGAEAFQRLRVTQGSESVLVDLVAEPVPVIESPSTASIGAATIQVDTPHEILVNKLCSLVSRSELRDLVDVRELLAHGGDLDRALRDAPRKDGGFSALTLAWVLRELPIESLAKAGDEDLSSVEELARSRDQLVARLTEAAAPGDT